MPKENISTMKISKKCFDSKRGVSSQMNDSEFRDLTKLGYIYISWSTSYLIKFIYKWVSPNYAPYPYFYFQEFTFLQIVSSLPFIPCFAMHI
jgi:hypothetical protein